MTVSAAVRRAYAERILAKSGRDHAPANFRPLEVPATGFSSVEGCRGGGKNILEIAIVGDAERVLDLRASCGLCNPAMSVATDVLVDWARGRTFREILALDPRDVPRAEALWAALGGPGRPDDAREKLQYALVAVQNAVRNHRGERAVKPPAFDEATARDWAEDDPEDGTEDVPGDGPGDGAEDDGA